MRSAAGARRRVKPPMGRGRADREEQQEVLPRAMLFTRQRGRTEWCMVIDPGEERQQMGDGKKRTWPMWRERRQWGRQEASW